MATVLSVEYTLNKTMVIRIKDVNGVEYKGELYKQEEMQKEEE